MPNDNPMDDAFFTAMGQWTKAETEQLFSLLPDGDDERMTIVRLMWRHQQHLAKHWQANNTQLAERLRLFTQRPDLPVDRLPAYQALAQYQDTSKALAAALSQALCHIEAILTPRAINAVKEARAALPTLQAALTLAQGELPSWDATFIHRLWEESWTQALRDAGSGVGNTDTAHINQPIVFAHKLLATVFAPSPSREQYAAALAAERESLKTWLSTLSERPQP